MNAKQSSDMDGLAPAAKRLVGPAIGGGFLGGLAYLVLMILYMGTSGMGYATPPNVALGAWFYPIRPPLAMLPKLMPAMGIHLPAQAMAMLGPALHSGHVSPAMAHKVGTMLMGMHVPAPKVHMIGALMTGHATNSMVATLMSGLPPAAQNMAMTSMPLSSGAMATGLILHFAFAGAMGVVFAAILTAFAWMRVPLLRTPLGVIVASTVGGGLLFLIMEYGILPSLNPIMAMAPTAAFLGAHLAFGLGVGVVVAWALFPRHAIASLPPAPVSFGPAAG